MEAASLQPNSEMTGHLAALGAMLAHARAAGHPHRRKLLVAQGTGPVLREAARRLGLEAVELPSQPDGRLDLSAAEQLLAVVADSLCGLAFLFPSASGLFEEGTVSFARQVHTAGGQVYANCERLTAQLVFTSAGAAGADLCRLSLRGLYLPALAAPGLGPVLCKAHLAPFLPGHAHTPDCGFKLGEPRYSPTGDAVCATAFAAPGALCLPLLFIKAMGHEGLRKCTAQCFVNANYLATRLRAAFRVLQPNPQGFFGPRLLLDLAAEAVSPVDFAKRLLDHGVNVAVEDGRGLLLEPGETATRADLDRLVDALLAVGREAGEVRAGRRSACDSPLAGAPHSLAELCAADWTRPYSRAEAALPSPAKVFPPVGRLPAPRDPQVAPDCASPG